MAYDKNGNPKEFKVTVSCNKCGELLDSGVVTDEDLTHNLTIATARFPTLTVGRHECPTT